MAEVRAHAGTPVAAQFSGLGAPTVCAPIVVNTTDGCVNVLKSDGSVVEICKNGGTADGFRIGFMTSADGLAYTITFATNPITTLTDGLSIYAIVIDGNEGATTLDPDGTGAQPIALMEGYATLADDFQFYDILQLVWVDDNASWIVMNKIPYFGPNVIRGTGTADSSDGFAFEFTDFVYSTNITRAQGTFLIVQFLEANYGNVTGDPMDPVFTFEIASSDAGPEPMFDENGNDLIPGIIGINSVHIVVYNETLGGWQVMGTGVPVHYFAETESYSAADNGYTVLAANILPQPPPYQYDSLPGLGIKEGTMVTVYFNGANTSMNSGTSQQLIFGHLPGRTMTYYDNSPFTINTLTTGDQLTFVYSNSSWRTNLAPNNVSIGLTAAGTNQATAFAMVVAFNVFSTVASGTGALLDASVENGNSQTVFNGGANALKVYPDTGSQINALAANSAMTLTTNTTCRFTRITSTRWIGELSA